MKRHCHCAGHCGPQSDLSRRAFLGTVGAGAATALLTGPSWAVGPAAPEELERWKRALLEESPPRVYRSNLHTDARMHLGGIGTGNFEVGVDGQFTTWQLFNTLRDGHVPFYFGVRVGKVAKLLQTTGGPEAPRVAQIEMTGEYPFAVLRFADPDLPIKLELTAFSPFAPLATALASVPVAAFVFRLSNPTAQPLEVSLGALIQNPVGYDAHGELDGARHPNFGGNINEAFREGDLQGVLLRAAPGREPELDRPVRLYVSENLRPLEQPPKDRPGNLRLVAVDRLAGAGLSAAEMANTLIWMEEPPADLDEGVLRAAAAAVKVGATLVFAGKHMPLLAAYGRASGGKPLAQSAGRPDVVFEDFEEGYGRWNKTGEAFGPGPASGTLPNQQRVSGFLGRGLVNTYYQGDGTVGRLASKPFKIERRYIRMLVGGGSHANTQMRLVLEGQVVRSIAGRNEERLLPAFWDVHEFEGKTAHLEIVDENQGGWGHINIDQIEFADHAGNQAVLGMLEELLPAWFQDLRPAAAPAPGHPNVLEFDQARLKPGASEESTAEGLRLLAHQVGAGRVIVAAGPMLDPALATVTGARQRAYAALCKCIGAHYVAPRGPLPKAPGAGTLALGALASQPTLGTDFPDCADAWRQFAARGQFQSLEQARPSAPTPAGQTATAAVAVTVEVPAGGAVVEVPFVLAWHYPNKYNAEGVWMGCHYATRWEDARAVLREAGREFKGWHEASARFRRALYDTTLPYWLVDCLSSQASIIRHIGVVFRIANGDVYGWEGSNGCCQPTCTHVWGYEQTLSRLFPDLERDMRRIDFQHQQRPDGGVNNRTDVPSPDRPTGEQPFADGHASCVLKAWREALNQTDDAWLKAYWPQARRAVEYLIRRDAVIAGGTPAGVLNDDQWNTYDEALHGVTTFIGTYYLAALRAGEEWARRVGETAVAKRFHAVFEKGQQRLIELCWNGEYFQQHLPDYLQRSGEVGPGCMADQLIGQWWAHQLGLGYLLPKEKVQAALRAVFKHNWKADLTGWKHMPRAFAGDRDKGLIICTWPKGGRPGNVMLYSDEVWTGIEYQVAAHLIYEGMIEEGLAIVKGARDRYDGVPRPPIPRNPWNEIECGGHYARAMSSWSLLLALSGFLYDGPAQALRFTPRHTPGRFRAFFCGPEGWGSLTQKREAGSQLGEIAVVEGSLALRQLTLAKAAAVRGVRATLNGQSIEVAESVESGEEVTMRFTRPVRLSAGAVLQVEIS